MARAQFGSQFSCNMGVFTPILTGQVQLSPTGFFDTKY